MHQEGGIHFQFLFRSTNPKDSRNPKLFSLFFGFMIRTFQVKISAKQMCWNPPEHRKKKVAFWAKILPPLLSPNDFENQKKTGVFFWCNEGFFHLFEGSSCKNIVISCKDAIHPLDDITFESPTHKQDWSFIQRQNSISSVYLEGFADANKKPQKKKYLVDL